MNRARSHKSIRGFTLIELLVVIAIIALLSAVVLASLNTARAKADDARRLADLREIQKAVELYYDANGHYPNSNGNNWTSFDSPIYAPHSIVSPNAANLSEALAPYITAPRDPKEPVLGDAGYLYTGAGNDYCILIYKTPENMNDFSPSVIPPRCGTVVNGQCTNAQGQVQPNAIYVGAGSHDTTC